MSGEQVEQYVQSASPNIPSGRPARPTKSPKRFYFSRPMTAATSTELNCSWTADSLKYNGITAAEVTRPCNKAWRVGSESSSGEQDTASHSGCVGTSDTKRPRVPR